MKASGLTVDQSIEICALGATKQVWARSRVLEFRGEGLVFVAVPAFHGVAIPLRPGVDVNIVAALESAVCMVRGRVVDRELSPTPGLLIQTNGTPMRVQRREFVRVPYLMDVELTWGDTPGGGFRRGATQDIGGGGLRLTLKGSEAPEVGAAVRIGFSLPASEKRFGFRTRIVWVDGSRMRGWTIGLAFGSITTSDRDRIISYCFERQRELLAKGMLQRGR